MEIQKPITTSDIVQICRLTIWSDFSDKKNTRKFAEKANICLIKKKFWETYEEIFIISKTMCRLSVSYLKKHTKMFRQIWHLSKQKNIRNSVEFLDAISFIFRQCIAMCRHSVKCLTKHQILFNVRHVFKNCLPGFV